MFLLKIVFICEKIIYALYHNVAWWGKTDDFSLFHLVFLLHKKNGYCLKFKTILSKFHKKKNQGKCKYMQYWILFFGCRRSCESAGCVDKLNILLISYDSSPRAADKGSICTEF